jgi:hypothetical protein
MGNELRKRQKDQSEYIVLEDDSKGKARNSKSERVKNCESSEGYSNASSEVLRLGEDCPAVLDNVLHGEVLRVHVCHLPLNAAIKHDCRSKDNRQILGCHQVL